MGKLIRCISEDGTLAARATPKWLLRGLSGALVRRAL